MMIDEKFILKSKTVWGIIITVLPQLALLFGVDFTADDAKELNDLALELVSVGGLILTAVGRFTAKNGLTFKV